MSSDSKTATAAPDRPSFSLVTLFLLAVLAGCASPAPPPARRQPAPEPPPQETPAPAPTPTPTPAPEAEKKDNQVVVLDPGGESEASTRTLVEAARAERERRAHAAPSAIVINDKNLKQHATGQLTVATPGKKTAETTEPEQPVRDEQYWRSRALEIRLRWRHAADDIEELETSANGWRRSFYAEKDPNVRNTRIKPEWDRALDRLEQARTDVEAAKKELTEFLEEGRTAGALPGWLREGIDQEPQEEPEPSNTHKVIEPPRADDKDGNG
ncbi:MAG: hypothetical protein ABUT39_02690 [Acidobacteriota bacterium]